MYFAGVFITVHLEAKKEGLRGLATEELPQLKPLLKKTYLLLPLILLIYLVASSTRSIAYAAAIAIAVALTYMDRRYLPRAVGLVIIGYSLMLILMTKSRTGLLTAGGVAVLYYWTLP